jgi:thiamine biosynthesis lipoprotein
MEPTTRAWVEQIMGMPISIHVRGMETGASDGPDSAVARAFEQLRRVDTVFSTWTADSQISRLRRGELALEACDQEVRDVVRLCDRAKDLTEGWFDADRPDDAGRRRFDPTGLVKGWAVQRACVRLAAALPDADVLVNAGGDIAVSCGRADTAPWRLAIENPLDRTALLATVDLRTGGLATSGTAARGAHIYSPATGSAATELASVSVIGPSLMWADIYATAAFARGPRGVEWLRTLEHHAWMVVDLDGRTISSTA